MGGYYGGMSTTVANLDQVKEDTKENEAMVAKRNEQMIDLLNIAYEQGYNQARSDVRGWLRAAFGGHL